MKTLQRAARYSVYCTGYLVVRMSSYIAEPRPYLWWHAAIDVAMIAILVGFAHLAEHRR